MLIYRLLITLIAPLLALALLIRLLRKQETVRDLCERLGLWRTLPKGKVIWLHGASNGELTAARPLIEALAQRRSTAQLLITCNTTSARQMVQNWGLARVDVRLAPLDLRWLYRRIMARMDLEHFILFEADFWPNRIFAAKQTGAATALIGGRMSDKSARGWGRFARIARAVFNAFDLICAQDAASEARLRTLGADPRLFGPAIALKSFYEGSAQPGEHKARQNLWLAASTHEGEDAALLRAHHIARETLPDLRMILAPRHPKRAGQIAKLAQTLALKPRLRSQGAALEDACDVYIADTLGEMDQWYRAAGICFVAGSLVPKGGHTPYEPAFHECALLHGPHLENFAEQYAALDAARGARLCETSADIAAALIDLQEPGAANTMRANARACLSAAQALDTVLNALDQGTKT